MSNQDDLEINGPSTISTKEAKKILNKYGIDNNLLLKDISVALEQAFIDGQESQRTYDFLGKINKIKMQQQNKRKE